MTRFSKFSKIILQVFQSGFWKLLNYLSKFYDFFPNISWNFLWLLTKISKIIFDIFSKYFLKFSKMLHKIFKRSIQYLLKYFSENRKYCIRYVALWCACHVAFNTRSCDIVICDIMLCRSTHFYLNVCFYTIRHYCISHIRCCM